MNVHTQFHSGSAEVTMLTSVKDGGTTWTDHREYHLLASAMIDLDHLVSRD
jgi:hypothetical protein